MKNFEDLKGKVIKDINVVDSEYYDEVIFMLSTGEKYKLYHSQDCCESVYIEDINGNLDDLIGSPIIMAEESTNEGEIGDYETFTWTFYKLATVKGYVTIRWYGHSNGCYSESVYFEKCKDEECT